MLQLEVEKLVFGILFKDIGQLVFDVKLVIKFGVFFKVEYLIVQSYVEEGFVVFEVIFQLFEILVVVVFEYYECYNGVGYFYCMMGDEIFVVGWMVVIVDSYDVMILVWFYWYVILFLDVLC